MRRSHAVAPLVSICIPHWQTEALARICLRSIRRHSPADAVEVILVDNGSQDGSLTWLRSLTWIRLIERPPEPRGQWLQAIFKAWNLGLQQARGDYFVTMHTDVFVKRDDWLVPFLDAMKQDDRVAGVGSWKLNLENPLYTLQKDLLGSAVHRLKKAMGLKTRKIAPDVRFPRSHCAMYRRSALLENGITFRPFFQCKAGGGGGGNGYSVARQLWEKGLQTRLLPVSELAPRLVHVDHGTAAVAAERSLNSRLAQRKAEGRVARLFSEPWVRQLLEDSSLDRAPLAA